MKFAAGPAHASNVRPTHRPRVCVECGTPLLSARRGLYCPRHAGRRDAWPPPFQPRLTGSPDPPPAAALLAALRSRGIEPYDAGGVLRWTARTGQMTTILLRAIKARQDELLALLAEEARP